MSSNIENIKHLKAPDLKKIFGVFGYFYDRSFNDKIIPSRETLEIVARKEIPFQFQEILQKQPQLIVVMMNPGSSKPLDKDYIPQLIDEPTKISENRTLTEAVPDNAQYQIMRFMLLNGHTHARILNLSDLREPKSSVFMKLWPQLDDTHSIFASERREGLSQLVGKPQIALFAWSQDQSLVPLAIKAENALNKLQTVGISKGEHLYSYPSPMLQKHKEKWLEDIYGQITLKNNITV